MNYYYLKEGEVLGPRPLEELQELCRSGEIPEDAQVCREGTESWQPLTAFDSIAHSPSYEGSLPSSPPPVPAAVSSAPQAQPPSVAVPAITGHDYAVVPFVAVIAHGQDAAAAAEQLQELIRNHARNGWEYLRLESVETYVQGDNGCFGIGATPPRTTVYSMAVFRR